MKKCSRCKNILPFCKFHKNKSFDDGWNIYCKDCKSNMARRWRQNNYDRWSEQRKNEYLRRKEKITTYQRLKYYGITDDQYDQKLVEQNNKCGICLRDQSELQRRLAVDHCHNTGKLRGLLCDNCNAGLGRFKDNLSRLKNAISYLNKYKK